MAGVFISYRRKDGGWGGRLKDHLQLRFGDKAVWFDVDDIQPGQQYPVEIAKAIKNSDAILVMIGPYWKKTGLKRLQDGKDVLRKEIVQALKSNKMIIPVLVGDAVMPQAELLPIAVRGLTKRQSQVINDADWTHGIQLLIEQLQRIVRTTGVTEPLTALHAKVEKNESQYFQFMYDNPKKALEVAKQTLELLDEQMPRYPQDIYLQLQRGYFLKNLAMALRDLGDSDGFNISLTKSEQIFNTIQEESKIHLASAYNGVGSVKCLQGNFKQSLHWIDAALELMPGYQQARQDKESIIQYLKKKNR